MKSALAIWTQSILRTGTAILESMQSVVSTPKRPEVGVIPTPDAPAPAQKEAAKEATKEAAPAEAPKRKPKMRAKGKGRRRARR